MMSAERPEDGEDTFGVRETDGVEGLEGWACGGSVPTLPGFSSVCAYVWAVHMYLKNMTGIPPHLAFNLFYYFLLQNNISLFNQKVYLIF